MKLLCDVYFYLKGDVVNTEASEAMGRPMSLARRRLINSSCFRKCSKNPHTGFERSNKMTIFLSEIPGASLAGLTPSLF